MYLVIELQTNGGQMANLAYSYSTRAEAESKFHAILSAAAVSSVDVHSAVVLDEEGCVLANGSYAHKETARRSIRR